MATKNAKIKLKIGPAAIVAILPKSGALLKLPGASSSSSSPYMAQEPPSGKSFSEYLVSFPFTEKILGPIPTENSTTFTPESLAKRKCPNSCINTIIPKIINAITIFKFLSFPDTLLSTVSMIGYPQGTDFP